MLGKAIYECATHSAPGKMVPHCECAGVEDAFAPGRATPGQHHDEEPQRPLTAGQAHLRDVGPVTQCLAYGWRGGRKDSCAGEGRRRRGRCSFRLTELAATEVCITLGLTFVFGAVRGLGLARRIRDTGLPALHQLTALAGLAAG
jgi:hypothetical protein